MNAACQKASEHTEESRKQNWMVLWPGLERKSAISRSKGLLLNSLITLLAGSLRLVLSHQELRLH